MGQKVNPISNRLGIIRGWDSNWADGKKQSDKILEDYKLRKYLNVRLATCSVSRIVRASHSPVNGSMFSSIHGTTVPSGRFSTCEAAYWWRRLKKVWEVWEVWEVWR